MGEDAFQLGTRENGKKKKKKTKPRLDTPLAGWGGGGGVFSGNPPFHLDVGAETLVRGHDLGGVENKTEEKKEQVTKTTVLKQIGKENQVSRGKKSTNPWVSP